MGSFFKKKFTITIAIVCAGVLICLGIVHFTGTNPVSNVIRTVFAPVQNGCAYIARKVEEKKNFVFEMKIYKEQNDQLIEELNQVKSEIKDISHYKQENDSLKELLELKQEMSEYSTVAASVIAYSSNNWYDTVEINKGTMHGISGGNAVITSKGVVGKVIEAGLNWSIVSTILNPESSIGVRVTRTGGIGVLEGKEELSIQSFCEMTFIEKGSNIIIGDLLETSGSGGIYPAGLMVGTIRDIEADNTGMLKSAVVEPYVDLSDMYEVLVITGIK